MPVPHADNPGMSWPLPVRIIWFFTSVSLSMLALLNLIYLVETPKPTPAAVIALTTTIATDDSVADPCSLVDVMCDGESRPPVVSIDPPEQIAPAPRPKLAEIKGVPVKKNASAAMQEMVSYAWELSKDMDFVLTIEAESGFNPAARNVNRNGTVDSGIAQINHYYHPAIVRDPRFKDWKWQLEQAWKLYAGGTKFFGHDVRYRVRDRFITRQ